MQHVHQDPFFQVRTAGTRTMNSQDSIVATRQGLVFRGTDPKHTSLQVSRGTFVKEGSKDDHKGENLRYTDGMDIPGSMSRSGVGRFGVCLLKSFLFENYRGSCLLL